MWSVQIMNELLNRASMYEFDGNGSSGPPPDLGDHKAQDQEKETSPYCALDSITEEQQPSQTKGEAYQQNKGTIRTLLLGLKIWHMGLVQYVD